MVKKIEKSSQFDGPKLFIAHSPCPPGWSIDSSLVLKIARIAVQSGVWPLKEAVFGDITHSVILKKSRRPIEEYLGLQERFEHLFKPNRQEHIIQKMQQEVDDYLQAVVK